MKLKLTWLVLGDVELTERQYLHHDTTGSTPKATTAAAIIITDIAIIAITITTGTAATATRANGIKGKNLGNVETVLN